MALVKCLKSAIFGYNTTIQFNPICICPFSTSFSTPGTLGVPILLRIKTRAQARASDSILDLKILIIAYFTIGLCFNIIDSIQCFLIAPLCSGVVNQVALASDAFGRIECTSFFFCDIKCQTLGSISTHVCAGLVR